jgi:hypothetical protein
MPRSQAKRFWDSIKKMRAYGVTKGRLQKIAEIISSGRSVTFETKRVVAHARKEHRTGLKGFFVVNDMLEMLPWRDVGGKKKTGVLDAVSIYRMLPRNPTAERGDE